MLHLLKKLRKRLQKIKRNDNAIILNVIYKTNKFSFIVKFLIKVVYCFSFFHDPFKLKTNFRKVHKQKLSIIFITLFVWNYKLIELVQVKISSSVFGFELNLYSFQVVWIGHVIPPRVKDVCIEEDWI